MVVLLRPMREAAELLLALDDEIGAVRSRPTWER